MCTPDLPATTLPLDRVPTPRTLINRFARAVIEGNGQAALTVLAAAGRRRALPRRLLFGHDLEGDCRRI